MAASNHIPKKCLGLGPSFIGSKSGNVGGDVIDDIVKQKLDYLPEGMIDKIENYLNDRFPEVYSYKLDKIISIPECYDYGVETKKKKKGNETEKEKKARMTADRIGRARQYGDDEKAKDRITELENLKDMKFEDVREKHFLEDDVIEGKKPSKCEDLANRRFKNFFRNEPGLFLHAFKPKEYLKEIKKIAMLLGQGE